MASTRYETTEYNRSERMLSKLRDIYSRARMWHWSHQGILNALTQEVYSTADFRKLKPYYRGQFDGMRRILADKLYEHLEWRLYFHGALVRSEDIPAGEWCDVHGGEHVWKDAPDKLFSTPAKEAASE